MTPIERAERVDDLLCEALGLLIQEPMIGGCAFEALDKARTVCAGELARCQFGLKRYSK